MNSLYPEFVAAHSKLKLNPQNVPERFWRWIPYAELWGISDDYYRDQFVSNAPQVAIDDLVAAFRQIDVALDDWLAGEESFSPNPSDEYCTFTCLRMAGDYAS
jgi:hypothetical protein